MKQDICFLLAVRTHQRQCDLIVCVGHPDKLASLKIQEAVKQQSSEVWIKEVMLCSFVNKPWPMQEKKSLFVFTKNTSESSTKMNCITMTFWEWKLWHLLYMFFKRFWIGHACMHAHRLAYMSTEKGANTLIETVVSAGQCPVGCSRQLWGCSSWLWSAASMSCSGVCVWWLISSFTPGKLWSTNITHRKWRGPNDAVQHNLASHVPRDVPQDVNLSVYFKRACWFFFVTLRCHCFQFTLVFLRPLPRV